MQFPVSTEELVRSQELGNFRVEILSWMKDIQPVPFVTNDYGILVRTTEILA